jgi:DNA helicase-2/ATP-dependent DNA helicase PcrA
MSTLLDQLNAQQRAAVELGSGPILVLAGAGSGKTRVITYRIAYLIQTRGVPPESILAVTFTNKAAEQMKERVAALLGGSSLPAGVSAAGSPHISTFHSFCTGVLRRHLRRLGYSPNFSIYDEDDQLRVVKAAIHQLGWEQEMVPRSALSRISYAKNCGLSPQDLRSLADGAATQQLAAVFETYQQQLREAQALDFDDLLLKTLELFDAAPDVLEEYNRRFQHLLVDEYQDTNRIQYQLIRRLTRTHQNLCVVGDEDQSIYRWRGADIQNILRFEHDYPGATVIRLEQNYRSTQFILDAATAVVERNQARRGKRLWTGRGPGRRLGLLAARNAEEEADWVAWQVEQALEEGADVAVLYRTNAQSRLFEEALQRRGVSYRMVGSLSFYARAEVKDLLAYARLAANPLDSAALSRVINKPARGIGERTLGEVEALARRHQVSVWEALDSGLYAAAGSLSARAVRALQAFRGLVRDLMEDRDRLPLPEFFARILERTGYLEMLEAEDAEARLESGTRLENVQELLNAAREAGQRGATLADFLDHASLVSEADSYDERARVTLMTLHCAKGLEFSRVFLVGLEEGRFPHQLSLRDPEALEEERRLCYVGMTRARDQLVLTWARERRRFGDEAAKVSQPSRFLSEIPPALIELMDSPGPARPWRTKPRTEWETAMNSRESVERFLQSGRRSPTATSPWKLGSQVRHPKYGLGVIVKCEPENGDVKLTISFPGYGLKKIMGQYATLEKA